MKILVLLVLFLAIGCSPKNQEESKDLSPIATEKTIHGDQIETELPTQSQDNNLCELLWENYQQVFPQGMKADYISTETIVPESGTEVQMHQLSIRREVLSASADKILIRQSTIQLESTLSEVGNVTEIQLLKNETIEKCQLELQRQGYAEISFFMVTDERLFKNVNSKVTELVVVGNHQLSTTHYQIQLTPAEGSKLGSTIDLWIASESGRPYLLKSRMNLNNSTTPVRVDTELVSWKIP